MTQKFVQLPNGTVLDVSQIAFIAASGLNEYHVFFARPAPVSPKMDGANRDALVAFLDAQVLVAKEAPEAKPTVIAAA